MAKGRKKTPTALRIVRGNPGKRALPKDEPNPKKAAVKPPRGLSTAAKKQWRLVARQLSEANILTVLDTHALVLYCEAFSRWLEANTCIAEEGMIVTTPKGYSIPSPYIAISNKAFDQMKSIMVEFGMTPTSRTGIKTVEPETEKSEWDD